MSQRSATTSFCGSAANRTNIVRAAQIMPNVTPASSSFNGENASRLRARA